MNSDILRVSESVAIRSASLLAGFKFSKHDPMVAVHIRRTDKITEISTLQMSNNEIFASFGILIRKLEASINVSFRSVFFLTDDPDVFNNRVNLTKYFMNGNDVTIFGSEFVSQKFTNNSVYKSIGHNSVAI